MRAAAHITSSEHRDDMERDRARNPLDARPAGYAGGAAIEERHFNSGKM